MKRRSVPRKLELKRQTLRNLDLDRVHGGRMQLPRPTDACPTWNCDKPPS